VTEEEHKTFSKIAEPRGGAAPALRSLIQRVIAGKLSLK